MNSNSADGDPDPASPPSVGAEDGLRSSVAALAGLLFGDGQAGLEDMLRHVAEFAVTAIPGADGAGLTLLEGSRADALVASAEFVRQVDDIQYRLGEGPCITAAAQARTVRTGSLGVGHAWPRFGPLAATLGVRSAMSLPLTGRHGVLGVMNIYAHAENAFSDRAIEIGESYAAAAASSVSNAHTLARARRMSAQLQAAIAEHGVVDQAIGIMMGRGGGTERQAFVQLRTLSASECRTVSEIAERVVADAVRRAQIRIGDAKAD